MKNGYMTIVGVKDLDESVAFYEKIIKCKLIKRFSPSPGIEIAFMLYNNAIEIELIKRNDVPPPDYSKSPVILAFSSSDVDADYAMLENQKVKCDSQPFKLPNGYKVVRFFDPNGLMLTFMEE